MGRDERVSKVARYKENRIAAALQTYVVYSMTDGVSVNDDESPAQ